MPKERLLVWHPRDGWDPLCKFLGKEVPAEPVPRVNDGDFTAKIFTFLVAMRVLTVLKDSAKLLVPVVVAGGAWWWWLRGL